MDRGAWQATVHGGHKESDMTEQLTTFTLSLLQSRNFTYIFIFIFILFAIMEV